MSERQSSWLRRLAGWVRLISSPAPSEPEVATSEPAGDKILLLRQHLEGIDDVALIGMREWWASYLESGESKVPNRRAAQLVRSLPADVPGWSAVRLRDTLIQDAKVNNEPPHVQREVLMRRSDFQPTPTPKPARVRTPVKVIRT